jgi:hypothetical protein
MLGFPIPWQDFSRGGDNHRIPFLKKDIAGYITFFEQTPQIYRNFLLGTVTSITQHLHLSDIGERFDASRLLDSLG